MSYSRYNRNMSPIRRSPENGYVSWYDECTCCPYGYHIDLDFVRYCESISKEDKNRTGSIKRRKDRRKQRQSREMLLGLTPPVLAVLDGAFNKPDYSQESPKIHQKRAATVSPTQVLLPFNDSFDDAVSDFERALQRSKNKLSNNLPDVTAVSDNLRRTASISSISSASGSAVQAISSHDQDGPLKTEFDTVSIESSGLSPMALQNIREALALSLERTRQLEHQVKLIPNLQDELTQLRLENRHLNLKLKSSEEEQQAITSRLNALNGNHVRLEPSRKRSQSFTHLDSSFEDNVKKEPPPPPPRKDFGVMCGVLTRNIGVGHQYPNTRHASTITVEFADKWLPEKAKFLNTQQSLLSPKITVTKGTQTFVVKEKRDMGIQTSILEPKKTTALRHTQTESVLKPIVSHVASMAVPQRSDIGSQKTVECRSVASSEDTIDNVICEKCTSRTRNQRSIGVGVDALHAPSVSLAALANRSKSFNLGEERLVDMHKKSRTVATQYENNLITINKYTQTEVKTSSKSSQHEVALSDKNTQHEPLLTYSKWTETRDLKIPSKSVGCQAKELRPLTAEKASNTVVAEEKEVAEEKMCAKCASKEMETSREFKREGGPPSSPTPSRIPVPTTPIEARKFKRQDTYTKIYSPSPTEKLSGLDLSPKAASTESISPFDKLKQNLRLDVPTTSSNSASGSKSQNGVNFASTISKVQIHETSLPVSESTIFQPPAQNRKKAVPSKEMQGAMKVLNDSLRKNPLRTDKNPTAINIVQQEWFKISSLVTANPLDVEDYLDAFEDMSSLLLQYIVNMTDISGNTAMHYAVSHGNFDVVSILLDSKVCDINKPNKAGYTSVMLVSLAEVRSRTHANVVRRLFQLADVNVRASQQGQTALMVAVSHGRLDMVRMLLEAGADINIQDADGSTALMCAAEHGHIDIVKHFLEHPDCDASITDVDGSTALKIAMDAGHQHIGVLLYAHDRKIQKSHPSKLKRIKSTSPKTPSSPLPIRSSHRALTDAKK